MIYIYIYIFLMLSHFIKIYTNNKHTINAISIFLIMVSLYFPVLSTKEVQYGNAMKDTKGANNLNNISINLEIVLI
jgi:hypothetical protein